MDEKRQVTESEKKQILGQHGLRCFVDGAPFDKDEAFEFHHIKAFSDGGPSTPDNVAPVCKRHHRSIGTMSLQEYRDKLELGSFFKGGEPKYLDDLIRKKVGHCGERLRYIINDNTITAYFKDLNRIIPSMFV